MRAMRWVDAAVGLGARPGSSLRPGAGRGASRSRASAWRSSACCGNGRAPGGGTVTSGAILVARSPGDQRGGQVAAPSTLTEIDATE